MNKFSKLAAAAALVMAGVSAHAASVIDDFSVAQGLLQDLTTGDGGVGYTTAVGASILGGSRDMFVEKTGAASDDGSAGVRAFVGSGRLNYSQDTGQSGRGVIRWDGAMNNATVQTDGLATLGVGLDLTTLGLGIRVQVLSADLNFPFTFQVWSDGDNDTVFTMSQASTLASSGPGIYDLFFGSFVGADFTNVGAVQLVLNNGLVNDIDIQIDIIRGIPEPGTLALVGAALLGLGAARRRKNAA